MNEEKSDQKKRYGNKYDKNLPNKRFDRSKKVKHASSTTNRSYTSAQWNSLTKEQQQAVKRHNSKNSANNPRSDHRLRQQLPPQHLPPPQQQMVNYVPPPPNYPRSISQYANTNPYGYQNLANRSVNEFTLPPRPGAAVIQPPPPRSLTPHPDGVSVINAHSGDVGQYFGNFGPPHPQM